MIKNMRFSYGQNDKLNNFILWIDLTINIFKASARLQRVPSQNHTHNFSLSQKKTSIPKN